MNINKKSLYTTRFVKAVLEGSRGAKIDRNRQTVCCSRLEGECSFKGELSDFFFIQIKNKYDFAIAAIELYDILLENRNPIINFLNFVMGIASEWELVAGNLSKTLLTSACLEGLPWRNGAILGGGPIPFFGEITSAYGDILLSFFAYLLRHNLDQMFNFGQVQEAFEQQRAECALDAKYWDSENFNPRKPFSYSACGPGPAAGREINKQKPYLLSLIPQMIWHACIVDMAIFLDPKTKFNSEFVRVIDQGKKLMARRFEIKKQCIAIGEKIVDKIGQNTIDKFSKSDQLLAILQNNVIVRKVIGNINPATERLILRLLVGEVPSFLSDPTTPFLNRGNNILVVGSELQKKLLQKTNSIEENENILRQSILVIDQVIQGIQTNNLTPEMFRAICLFYNQTNKLLEFKQNLTIKIPQITDFNCNG